MLYLHAGQTEPFSSLDKYQEHFLTRIKTHTAVDEELYGIKQKNLKRPNTSIEGNNVKVGDMLVNRLIPADSIVNIGPFLLLEHGYPVIYKKGTPFSSNLNEHPHRGLVAFTYVIKGEVEHVDSLGNHEIVAEGGAHWLSAGKGVIHGERVSACLVQSGGTLHAIQFWTNIPAANRGDLPKYKALNADAFPVIPLPNQGGVIHILLGKCGVNESPVESLSHAFLYRVTLNAKSKFRIPVGKEMNCAVFVPDDPVVVNGDLIGKSQLLIIENSKKEIVLRNPGISNADAFIMGGPEPSEPLVVQGPFVMNSREEIAVAYRDFFAGEYGAIPRP
jgi:redox-sensitive bicupin YhaK (pirin superfamily)